MNTYILFWGPTLSWYDLNEVEDEIEEGICREFAETKPWPITSRQDIKKGDRFFILCVEDTAHANCHSFIDPRSKDAKFYALDGICFGGFFTSDPYDSKDEDDGERVIDLQFDFAVFPAAILYLAYWRTAKCPGFSLPSFSNARSISFL